MKLSDYIKGLQEILDEHGDLDCYYSIDDEGNGYQRVNYDGSIYYKEIDDSDSRPELKSEEDLEEYDDEDKADYIKVCLVN